MSESKSERRRLERARKRKQKHLQAVAEARRESHLLRGLGAAIEADADLRHGDTDAALSRARRAATLRPRDIEVACLYAEAARVSNDLREERRALEHLAKIVVPDATLLIRLAYLCLQTGDPDRARDLARRGRALLPRRMKNRKGWIQMLEVVEALAGSRGGEGGQLALAIEFGEEGEPEEADLQVAKEPQTDETSVPGAIQASAYFLSGKETAEAPEPSPPLEIPVEIPEAVEGLEALGGGFASLEDVELAGIAARIRDAESYDRLLTLDHARDLLRLSHQEETARRVLTGLLGRALLADEVGLGKTIEAAIVLKEYLLRGRVESALVLVPPSLVGQWREELAAKFTIEARTTEDAEFRVDPDRFWSAPGVAIASIATARSTRHRDTVTERSWDLVIIDEAHVLKNARTEAYALVSRLTSRFLLLLTATPVENRLEELYNLVSLIRPGHLGGRREFLGRYDERSGRASEAARRDVRTLLGEIMIRNTRALSGVRLPPRFARTLLVAPDVAEGELYRHLVSALRALGAGGRTRLLLSVLLQEAGSSPDAVRATLEKIRASDDRPSEVLERLAPAIDFLGGGLRTAKGRALLQILGEREPTVVFTRFRATLDFLAATLAEAGVASERMDGGVPARLRREVMERAREHGSVLLSTDVGSEGLNLQFCRRIVNFDLPWNPMRIEQRIGRVHRIGQEHPVDVVNLCLAGSIEERILEILDQRINLFELVVGEVEMILGYLEEEREFQDLVFDAFADPAEGERERSFRRIGEALASARRRYQGVKSFDEGFFRNELGV
jgi:superfamily II DNA or RNA helicase